MKRFSNWKYPTIEDGKATIYNWIVQNLEGLVLGHETDIGAFSYINALYGVVIEDNVQIGSHCSVYSVSTIDDTWQSFVKTKLPNWKPFNNPSWDYYWKKFSGGCA